MIHHPSTDELIIHLRERPPQSLLLSGPMGIGLASIAHAIALGGTIRHEVWADTSKATPVIKVETIRELYDSSKGKSPTRQFIIIHDAHTMTKSAQAAFLKLLEEPASSLYFILTSHKDSQLLPTVRSRLQQYVIQPITKQQSDELINTHRDIDQSKRDQLHFIAEGLPEELEKLLNDDSYFQEAVKHMIDARNFLQAASYERLLMVNVYKDDRSASIQLISSAISILRRSLSGRPNPSVIEKLSLLASIEEALRANMSVRLQLCRYVL